LTSTAATVFSAKQGDGHDSVDLGPFGTQPLQNMPQSVTAVPESLIVNQQST